MAIALDSGPRLRPNSVGVMSVVSFALNSAAPIMVVGAYLVTAWAVTRVVAVGLAMLGVGAALAVWCVGYVSMARYIMNAGSLYSFLVHGLGARVAVAGASVQLVAYSLLQVGLYGIVGSQAQACSRMLPGSMCPGGCVPWWLCALVAWATVLGLGTRGVSVSSRLLLGAMAIELAVIVVIYTVDLTHPLRPVAELGMARVGALDRGGTGRAVGEDSITGASLYAPDEVQAARQVDLDDPSLDG